MHERIIARIGGWAAIVGGLFGAGSAILLLVVPPAVPADVFNFPFAAEDFALIQWVFLVHHVVIAVALWAYWRAGLSGRSRLGTAGAVTAVGAMLGLAVWEVAAVAGTGLAYPSEETAWIDAGYGIFSIASAVGMILLGVATIRAHVLTGATRWIVLITGVYIFVPNLPLLFAGFVAGRIALAIWMLLFVWLGWGMLRWSATASTTSTARRVEAAPA